MSGLQPPYRDELAELVADLQGRGVQFILTWDGVAIAGETDSITAAEWETLERRFWSLWRCLPPPGLCLVCAAPIPPSNCWHCPACVEEASSRRCSPLVPGIDPEIPPLPPPVAGWWQPDGTDITPPPSYVPQGLLRLSAAAHASEEHPLLCPLVLELRKRGVVFILTKDGLEVYSAPGELTAEEAELVGQHRYQAWKHLPPILFCLECETRLPPGARSWYCPNCLSEASGQHDRPGSFVSDKTLFVSEAPDS